jgi:hypothetical protein
MLAPRHEGFEVVESLRGARTPLDRPQAGAVGDRMRLELWLQRDSSIA